MNKGTTYYAVWEANRYTVTYNKNADDSTINLSKTSDTTTYGSSVAVANATRKGYQFLGWTEAQNGSGTKYTYGTKYPINKANNITLYAQWQVQTYTITFIDGDRKQTVSQAYNTNVTLLNWSKTGYDFGWYTRASGGTYIGGANATVKMPEGGATYYAHHSAKQYKVYFNGNGASVSTSYMSVTYDSTYGNLPTPSRTGYTFIGWFDYSYKDAPLKYYADMYTDLKNAFGYDQYRLWNHYTNYGAREGRRVSQYLGSDTVKITSDITIYAGWLANQYTVSYDGNGGAGSRNTDTVTYNTLYTTPSNPFSRTGYTFAGWNERADGTGTDWTNWIGRGWTWTYTNSIKLYAQWSKNPYKIYYQAGTGNGNTVYEQYYYDSWYQIRNHGNGFSKTGYSFAGWYASDGTNVTGWSGTYGWTGDLWLTAHWTANTYKVTYDAGGGNGYAEQWVTYDSYYALKSDGSGFWRTYYDFSWWRSSANGGNWTGWSGIWQYAGNVTLTAQWNLHTYHVYYQAGNGQGNRQESTYRYGDWFQIKGDGSGFWKTGHDFAGWKAPDGVYWTNRSGNWSHDGDVVLTAQWTEHEYTVYLHKNNHGRNRY